MTESDADPKPEQTDADSSVPEEPPADRSNSTDTPHPSSPPNRGRLLTALFALLLLVLGCAGALTWFGLIKPLQERQATLEQTLIRQQGQLASEVGTLKSAQNTLQQAVADAAHQIEAITEQNLALQRTFELTRAYLGSSQDDWQLSEAQYLLVLANRILQLERDPARAARALTLADEALARLAHPGLRSVRHELAREKLLLEGLPTTDIQGISSQLESIRQQLPNLPRYSPAPGAPNPSQADDQSASHWWQRVWRDLSGFVTVHRTDEPINTLMSPTQQQLVTTALQLRLVTAETALVRGDAITYRLQLQAVRNGISEIYLTGRSETQAVLQSLSQLGSAPLAGATPDISGSLTALRQLRRQWSAADETLSDSP
ncbi:MAG: uroporphyrinogen-III C-methyltransferase [Gammaproteobacteria bacterium]|nr:uroporphyrinogen-III C-methyltransferase [Gammaproteobacteria bacterium]